MCHTRKYFQPHISDKTRKDKTAKNNIHSINILPQSLYYNLGDCTHLNKITIYDGKNLPTPDRVCLMCAEGAVEDEFNFLCVCKKYEDIRKSLYNKTASRNVVLVSLSNEDKFMLKFENVPIEGTEFLIMVYKS